MERTRNMTGPPDILQWRIVNEEDKRIGLEQITILSFRSTEKSTGKDKNRTFFSSNRNCIYKIE